MTEITWRIKKVRTHLSRKMEPYALRPRGLMDKASDFGSEDSRFESWRGRVKGFHVIF